MWRVYAIVVVLLMAASGYVGYQLHPDIPVPAESKEQSKEKVVKTITRPDGTVIREERNKQTASQKETPPPPAAKTKWAVDARWIPVFSGEAEQRWDIGGAYRVGQTNLWITGGIRPDTKDVAVGVRIEF